MLPKINHIEKRTAVTDVFYGYNHRLKIGDGESYDEENLSSDFFPVMSPVKGNGDSLISVDPDAYNTLGVYALDDRIGLLIYEHRELVNTRHFDIYDTEGTLKVSYDVSDFVTKAEADAGKKWNVVTMGALIVFYPIGTGTGFVINSALASTSPGAVSAIGRAEFTAVDVNVYAATIDYEICKGIQPNPPAAVLDGALWINSNSGIMYRYSVASDTWTAIYDTYAVLTFPLDIEEDLAFSDGDAIKIDGMATGYEYLDGIHTILKASDVYEDGGYTFQDIVISTAPRNYGQGGHNVRISTPLPSLDFVFSHENRLWGCKYGTVGGVMVNSIYCSKLGDPGNWYSDQGISTDSYEATIGDMGKWTGAVSFNGNPVFFKKDRIYTVYGSYPAEFTLQSVVADGVDEGSIGSIAYVGGYLYYYSPSGFMRYSSYPQFIGESFENQSLNISNGIGTNHKYYAVSGKANDDTVYCFDTLKNLWHIEKHEGIKYATEVGDQVFVGGQNLYVFHGGDYGKWFYVSGDLGIHNPTTVSHYTSGVKANNRHQYVSKLTIRAKLTTGAKMSLWLSYDDGGWEHQATITSPTMDVYEIPVKPKRCHSFRLKIEGEGDCKIYAITKDIEEGSV